MGQESGPVDAAQRQHNWCHQHMGFYTGGIVNWQKDELEAVDTKTRKMMTIYNSLYPRADMDCLYIP